MIKCDHFVLLHFTENKKMARHVWQSHQKCDNNDILVVCKCIHCIRIGSSVVFHGQNFSNFHLSVEKSVVRFLNMESVTDGQMHWRYNRCYYDIGSIHLKYNWGISHAHTHTHTIWKMCPISRNTKNALCLEAWNAMSKNLLTSYHILISQWNL